MAAGSRSGAARTPDSATGAAAIGQSGAPGQGRRGGPGNDPGTTSDFTSAPADVQPGQDTAQTGRQSWYNAEPARTGGIGRQPGARKEPGAGICRL